MEKPSRPRPASKMELIELLKQRAATKGLTPGTRDWDAYVFGTAAREWSGKKAKQKRK